MRILVFGASTTQGFYDQRGGWVQRLAAEYNERTLQAIISGGNFKTDVFNLGVSGDTAADVRLRLEPEATARRLQRDQSCIVIAIGTNDSALQLNRARRDEYEFQADMEAIIANAKKFTDRILLVGLTAVDEDRTDPFAGSSKGSQYHNNRLNLFEDTVKQVAERAGLAFVPIHDQFLELLEAGHDLLSDGLHPNEAGHQLILELIKPELEKLTGVA